MDNTPDFDAADRAGIRDANREMRRQTRNSRVNAFAESVGKRETRKLAAEANPVAQAPKSPEGWSVAAAVRRSELEGLEGPSDSELRAIEGETSPSATAAGAFYTPEEIARTRKSAAQYTPKTGMRGYSAMAGDVNDISSLTTPKEYDPDTSKAPTRSDSPVPIFSTEEGEIGRSREISYGGASIGSLAEEPGLRESPFTRIKEGSDVARKQLMGAGLLMLREAGRCDSPGCQMLRSTGMKLTGQTQRMAAGKPSVSNEPAIPAVHTMKNNVVVSKPADPANPEFKAIQKELQGSSGAIFTPEDALEHNHEDEAAHLAYVQKRIAGFTKHVGEYND